MKFDIKPAIELARNGWEVFNYTANVMAGDSREWLENPENNWDAYLNENGQIKTAGDLIIDEGELIILPNLYIAISMVVFFWAENILTTMMRLKYYKLVFAKTLERMATDESKDTFYSGDLSEDIAADLSEIGAILTLEDLRNYKLGL